VILLDFIQVLCHIFKQIGGRFAGHIPLTALVQETLQGLEKLHFAQCHQGLPVPLVQVYAIQVFYQQGSHAVSLPKGIKVHCQHSIGKPLPAVCFALFAHKQIPLVFGNDFMR